MKLCETSLIDHKFHNKGLWIFNVARLLLSCFCSVVLGNETRSVMRSHLGRRENTIGLGMQSDGTNWSVDFCIPTWTRKRMDLTRRSVWNQWRQSSGNFISNRQLSPTFTQHLKSSNCSGKKVRSSANLIWTLNPDVMGKGDHIHF